MTKSISMLVVAAIVSSLVAPVLATPSQASNVSKTRAEISMTFARNSRG